MDPRLRKRFHRGCDIAPVKPTPTGRTTTVQFTRCETGEDYLSTEPTFTADDPVFAVFQGRVHEAVTAESESDFGIHVVLEHSWPDGSSFFTVYGHLSELRVHAGDGVQTGQQIGRMGATSRSPDARNSAPYCAAPSLRGLERGVPRLRPRRLPETASCPVTPYAVGPSIPPRRPTPAQRRRLLDNSRRTSQSTSEPSWRRSSHTAPAIFA